MLRALWLVVAHDLLEYRHMDDVTGKLFSFVLSNMARGFENVCEIISNWASEGLEKSLAGAVYESILVRLKMPKLEQMFKIAVIATKRLTVLKIFARLFCFEKVKVSEKFRAAVYKYDREEKKKPTRKVALVTLQLSQLAQIEQSSATRQGCRVSFVFIV